MPNATLHRPTQLGGLCSAAYGKGGKPEADEVAVEGVETVVPFVVQECKKAPKESVWEKAKAE